MGSRTRRWVCYKEGRSNITVATKDYVDLIPVVDPNWRLNDHRDCRITASIFARLSKIIIAKLRAVFHLLSNGLWLLMFSDTPRSIFLRWGIIFPKRNMLDASFQLLPSPPTPMQKRPEVSHSVIAATVTLQTASPAGLDRRNFLFGSSKTTKKASSFAKLRIKLVCTGCGKKC